MFNTSMTSSTSPTTSSPAQSRPGSPKAEFRLAEPSPTEASGSTVASSPLLDAFSVSSVLNSGLGLEKAQQAQLYSPFDQQVRQQPSTTPHLLSSLSKDSTTRDYFLHASSYLDPSQQSLFSISHLHPSHPLQMSSSYADSTSRALSPNLLGSDRMAAVSSLRHCANPYNASSLSQSDETSKFLSAMQPNSSSIHAHLSPALSAHYESSYRSFGRRVHDLPSSQPWKSMYSGQVSALGAEPQTSPQPQYMSPPPAHNNTSSGRYLSTSGSYSVPTPLVTSPYLLSGLSGSDHAATSTSETGIHTGVRKYHRRSNTTNRIPPAVKETEEYKVKRERNNVAVRKSREKSKKRLKENEGRAHELMLDNEQLRNKVKILSNMLHGLRVLLNTCGVSQEKINFEISKTIEPDMESSMLGNESIFGKTLSASSSKMSSTHGFGHHSMAEHEYH